MATASGNRRPAAARQRSAASAKNARRSTAVRANSRNSTNRKKNPKKNKSGKHSVIGSILKVLLLAFLLFALFMVIYVIVFIHGDTAINLEDYKTNQAQTSIIYAKKTGSDKYTEIATLHGEQNRIWVNIDDIPTDVQNAFIDLEDKRFPHHNGVDWIRTIAAIVKYHGKQGGSTLTQQLIKNLTDENQVTVARKLKEILYALNLEKNYSKEEILEAYLNTIPLGSGCYGVQTAAEKYFGKELKDLNVAEAACMASITKAPTMYNPLLYPKYNKERQEYCLESMYDAGHLNKKQYQQAVAYKLVLTNSEGYEGGEDENTDENTNTEINSYYVDYVINSIIDDLQEKYNYSRSEAINEVYSGGLRIYSCENPTIQEAAEYVYENRTVFPYEAGRTEDGAEGTKKKVQSAITIMDYEGHVVAMVGGAGKKTINLGLNRATDAIRSPGSSIKPLTAYGPAVEEGKLYYSSPIENVSLTINGEKWPRNYAGDYGAKGNYVSAQYALAQSLNTCAAQVVDMLGTSTSFKYATEHFHLSTLVKDGAYTDDNMSSMAVGGMTNGVTTEEMCAAYATFGNGGKYYKPTCYTKVTNYTGTKTLLSSEDAKPEQAISAGTAGVLNKMMQTVVTQGTGRGCGVTGFESYMKTGTTSDTKDKWACGGTPYYVAAVWYGYDEQEEMPTTSNNPAAVVWSAVMNRFHNGLKAKEFDFGDAIVSKAYCTSTGLPAGPRCRTASGWFAKDTMPEPCNGSHSHTMGQAVTTGASTAPKSTVESSDAADPEDETTTAASTSATTAITEMPSISITDPILVIRAPAARPRP